MVGEAGMLPSTARISCNEFAAASETKTSPLLSTATPSGVLNPLASVVTQAVLEHPRCDLFDCGIAYIGDIDITFIVYCQTFAPENPPPTMLIMGEAGMLPSTARISYILLLMLSEK